MKKSLLSWALALSALVTVSSCSSSTQERPATEAAQTEAAQTEAAAADTTAAAAQTGQMAYLCPMKCSGSASMKPGKCPVCGMDLEQNPAAAANGANQQ